MQQPSTLITRQRLQVALGLIWLLDGGLQLQPFMFSGSFLPQVIEPAAQGQPSVVATGVLDAAHLMSRHLALAVWVTTQGAGGLTTGQATDPNTGPLLVLLSAALYLPAAAPAADTGPSPGAPEAQSRGTRQAGGRAEPATPRERNSTCEKDTPVPS